MPPDKVHLVDAFGMWAFGPEFRSIDTGLGFLQAWNNIHAKQFKLEPNSSMSQDMPLMIEHWEKTTKDNAL